MRITAKRFVGVGNLALEVAMLAIVIIVGVGSMSGRAFAANAAANPCKINPDGTVTNQDPANPCVLPDGTICNNAGVQSTDKANCKTGDCAADPACSGPADNNLVTSYINPLVKLLTALIGVIVVISIVAGGIMYASAGGDANKVAAAKKRITNSLLALIMYLFLGAFLQYIVPGGIL